MLSSVLLPIDNIPVGQHPYIIRLLKGVFNSRPPSVKLLPEWDLKVVLEALQKPPFEPLKQADLKFVTDKNYFSCSHHNVQEMFEPTSIEIRGRCSQGTEQRSYIY